MSRFLRPLSVVLSFLFLCLGLTIWFRPELASQHFGLAPTGDAGWIHLRADFGALFLGLGSLALFGAWQRRRAPLAAAAGLLVWVVIGRLLGAALATSSGPGGVELALELVALLVFVAVARGFEPHSGEACAVRGRARTWIVAALVLPLAAAGTLFLPAVQDWLFERGARALSGRTNEAPFADDALRVAIAGSSAPLPSANRAKASVVVFAGGKFWVVDSGPESVENLVLWGIPLARIGGVLLTHFHSDHIGDLGELQLQTWAGGRREPLDVYGGPGVEGVVDGFNRAYALDQGYRTAHHGESVMPSQAWGMRAILVVLDGPSTPAKDRSALVLDDGELRITAIEVDHAPIEPAYAYRFDYKGRSVVITGDLKFHPPLVRWAEGADLLVSESISRSMTRTLEHAAHEVERPGTEAILHDVQDYHISPEEAAQLANEAGVGHLAFYHLLPAPDSWLARQLFARGINAVRPAGWTIADDGDLYTLPLQAKAIHVGRVDG